MPQVDEGQGCWFTDTAGNRYLDLASGYVCASLGHGHPAVVGAIAAQAKKLCWVSSAYQNEVRELFAATAAEISPWPEGFRVHFGSGGAESNDDAIRISRQLTGRPKILSAYRSYHGGTIGAAGITGIDRWRDPVPSPPGMAKFVAPFPYRSPFHTDDPAQERDRALQHLAMVISHEGGNNIAALIIEPMTGSSGVVSYPEGYLAGVRALCDQAGIVLVFDEVMTGFGRLGTPFAAHRFGVEPDLITFAKGVSSAYAPLSGVLIKEDLACHFDHHLFDVGHTYSGHVLAVAAGVATLRALIDNDLIERVNIVEQWLTEGLSELASRHAIIGDTRGIGALFGIDLVSDRETREPLVECHDSANAHLMQTFFADLRSAGVHTYGRYNIVIVAPPFNIERHELQHGLDGLDDAFTKLKRRL